MGNYTSDPVERIADQRDELSEHAGIDLTEVLKSLDRIEVLLKEVLAKKV